MAVYRKYSHVIMRPVQSYQVQLVAQSHVSPHQKLLLIFVNWSRKIRVFLHGKFEIVYWRKVFAIRIMCQVLVLFHAFYATNLAQLVIAIIRPITIHTFMVHCTHRIHTQHYERQHHAEVHRHHKQQRCQAHIGHHRIQSPTFWPAFIIRQYFVARVQLCQQHKINCKQIVNRRR